MKALIVAREQAMVERMVSLVRDEGLDVIGVTSEKDALAQLASEDVVTLVVAGGLQQELRRRLTSEAERRGIAVIPGALRGKDPETFARQELVPMLRRTL